MAFVPAKSSSKPERQDALDDDVAEFAALLGETLRNIRRAGPPPQQLRDALDRASLGNRHRPALLAVALSGPISVSELAKRLGLLLSSTSTIVGQLDRAGLLQRAEDDNDRRRTIVYLHPDHQQVMDQWLDRAMAPVRETLQQLSPVARTHFMEGWRILHREAARLAADGGPDVCVE